MKISNRSGRFLESLGFENMRADLGPTQEWLEALGNPQKEISVVLVAGTNGKGATSATLAGLLPICIK